MELIDVVLIVCFAGTLIFSLFAVGKLCRFMRRDYRAENRRSETKYTRLKYAVAKERDR